MSVSVSALLRSAAFGVRCAHAGLCVPVDALRLPKEEEDVPQPGSRVIALRQSRGGLWCTAEVQSIDELTATVAFQDDGERAKVRAPLFLGSISRAYGDLRAIGTAIAQVPAG